jgi:succinylglutamate desuccinylase
MKHLIGSYTGAERGPLVVITGGVHGNEPAGVQAIEVVLHRLKHAANTPFKGKIIGLAGHPEALQRGVRFVERDLNRLWTPAYTTLVAGAESASRSVEDQAMVNLLQIIGQEIHDYKPDRFTLLDLHTTSAADGVFCIPTDDLPSRQLAEAIGAPVLLSMLDGIDGTLLHYVAGHHFSNGIYPHTSVGCAFEGGQHNDPASVSRCVTAIFRCLQASGCIARIEGLIEGDALPEAMLQNVPRVMHLLYVHEIKPEYQFRMRPGYRNFQPVTQGEYLADDRNGAIPAPMDGYIVMPLYQPTGSDGFFIVGDKI